METMHNALNWLDTMTYGVSCFDVKDKQEYQNNEYTSKCRYVFHSFSFTINFFDAMIFALCIAKT